ncbi:MAG: GNAT family N-acetyltransferase [Thermoflexales bacterium]
MTLPAPGIPHPVRIALANARTGELYTLESLDDIAHFGPQAAAQVAAVCSELLLYERLFRHRLDGHPYDEANGWRFLTWAESHWREGTAFVFVITHPLDGIVGALDIKSTDMDGAEIGYWLSARHGGVMTNAVTLMRDLAWAAGYRALFALTDPDNTRSQAVLNRVGFVEDGMFERNGETYRLFRIHA